MHQDQRIGLAMAVLLLGAAGAFFFRHDPRPADSSLRLKSGRELDARIAEKSIAPYLQGTDEDHEIPGTRVNKVSDRTKGGAESDSGNALPQLDVPDFFGPDDRSLSGATSRANGDADERTTQELAPIPFPDLNDGDPKSRQTTNQVQSKSPTGNERIHVVQRGETLSSIAAKELGSAARFQEMYEANRDQLNDANDVRVGMSLRVPDRRAARVETPPSRSKDRINTAPPLLPSATRGGNNTESSPVGTEPDKATAPAPAKKLFEPAKRPPIGIRGQGSQSSDAGPASRPSRKLSQLPPESGGKVAR